MAKAASLDTPFRKGEAVIATCDLKAIDSGTKGKIQLANGLGNWKRYWVRFENGLVMGHVSHNDLARPHQLKEWQEHQESLAEASKAASEETPAAETSEATSSDTPTTGAASQIPEHLLERSRAAKARLLG